MATVKFGDSKEFKLFGNIAHPEGDKQTLYITLPVADVDASELIAALDAYGGTITEYDEDGKVVGDYHDYEDRPSFTTTYNNGVPTFFMVVSPIKLNQLTAINKSLEDQSNTVSALSKTVTDNKESTSKDINSLNEKTAEMETTLDTNTSDVASALESIASLFELMTADGGDDTSDAVDSSSESGDSSESESETDTVTKAKKRG